VRLRVLLIGGLACIMILPAASASAKLPSSAPANDTISGATSVSSIPFDTTEDTTNATTDSQDSDVNANCGAPHTDASVWFTIASGSDQELIVDVSQSNYSAGVIVASGSPGNLTLESCGPAETAFYAASGTTYYILAFDDQSDGSGNGGQLVLSVAVAPPPPQVSVTIDPRGHLDRQGDAIISGTETCTAQDLQFSELDVNASQSVGRVSTIQGSGFGDLVCDGAAHAWSVVVYPFSGKFVGGSANVSADGFACNVAACNDGFASQTVQLRR